MNLKPMPLLAATGILIALVSATLNADEKTAAPKPLKVLLITGGCCHDYAKQKDILKLGLESRINVIVDQMHTDDKSTKPPLALLGNADYAKGYDLVIHDECAADIKDPAVVEGVLAPHRAGTPGVNLHCAMHCYRVGAPGKPQTAGTPEALWFDYLGLQSSGHGPQKPIALSVADAAHPITSGYSGWTTINEELYNNIQIFPSAHSLIKGKQDKGKPDAAGQPTFDETVVAWTNEYGASKTRVFSTTVGHNNATVEDPRYLDLVARGVLWATGKLDAKGQPTAGYSAVTVGK
jgi:Trehalose utilisation